MHIGSHQPVVTIRNSGNEFVSDVAGKLLYHRVHVATLVAMHYITLGPTNKIQRKLLVESRRSV